MNSKLLAVLVLVLVACGDDGPTNLPNHTPELFCDLDAGTCQAAYDVARSVCDRNARCWGADRETCIDEVIVELCAVHDCAASYEDWRRLYQCIAQYDGEVCVTTGPLATCEL